MARCPEDRPLHAGYATGTCGLCGAGPLHIDPRSGSESLRCRCSFLRSVSQDVAAGAVLVCRACAVAIDFGRHGASRVTGHLRPTYMEVATVARQLERLACGRD